MSGIATGTAIAIAGGLGAAGSVAGGLMGMSGANSQADAAMQAAQLQYQAQEDALHWQEKQFNTIQGEQMPWITSGQGAVSTLAQLLGIGKNTIGSQFGSLLQGFNTPFVAPTGATEQNDPGYQFRLKQGETALENSAAARGGLLSSGTAKEQQQFGQDYASNEYSNVYNRALQNWENQFNVYETNQGNQFNRLSALAGLGQTSTAQMGQLGASTGNTIANILQSGASSIGGDIQNAAAARASGYVGLGNSISGIPGNLSSLYMLSQMMNNNGGLSYVPDPSLSFLSGING